MGSWRDKNRVEQPKRVIPTKPLKFPPLAPPGTYPPAPLHPMNFPETHAPRPATPELPYVINAWCKPKPNAPAQWKNVNAYSKGFIFPGMKHEIRPRKPGDLGEYRDAIPGESIVLYDNSVIGRTGLQNAGVFVDDTTEALFRQWFDFGGV